jgi:hypothetical protein
MRAGMTTTGFMALAMPCGGSPRKPKGAATRARGRLGARGDTRHKASQC